jgi:transcription elongation factor Elf1
VAKHLKGYPCPQCGKKVTVYVQFGNEHHECQYCGWKNDVMRPNSIRKVDFSRFSDLLAKAGDHAFETMVKQMEVHPDTVEALYGDGNQPDDGFEAHCDEMARLGDERYI